MRKLAVASCVFLSIHVKAHEGDKNFAVAVYFRAKETV